LSATPRRHKSDGVAGAGNLRLGAGPGKPQSTATAGGGAGAPSRQRPGPPALQSDGGATPQGSRTISRDGQQLATPASGAASAPDRKSERDHRLTLPDGRKLGYALLGEPSGFPVVYAHGFPSSRLEAGRLDVIGREVGARIIAPDRPGIGLSDPRPDRQVIDWPDDLRGLVDALGLERFSLIGCSGGFPYAAAAAFRLRDRVFRLASLSGLGPTTDPQITRAMGGAARLGFFLARRMPRLFDLAYGTLGRAVTRFPDLVFSLNEATPPDAAVLSRPEVRASFRDATIEAFRQGHRGPLHELRLLARPWAFDPAEITTATDIWHGCLDGVVPFAMAQALASRLPNAQLRVLEEDGHLSPVYRHGTAILQPLVR
jgi:pimeloyl-ACP methyl ester carboxylesterase